jgi:hypothetical protein
MKKVAFLLKLFIVFGIVGCGNNAQQTNSVVSLTDSIGLLNNSDTSNYFKCNDTLSKYVYVSEYVAGQSTCASGIGHGLIILADCVTVSGKVIRTYSPENGDGDFVFNLKLDSNNVEILRRYTLRRKNAIFKDLIDQIALADIHCEIIWANHSIGYSKAKAFYDKHKLENWKNPIECPKDDDVVEVTGRFVIDVECLKESSCLTFEIHPVTKLVFIKRNKA